MAIDLIWAWRKRRDFIRRRALDVARFYLKLHDDYAHAMVVKEIKRLQRGSFDYEIHCQAERTLRQSGLGSARKAGLDSEAPTS